MTLVSWPSELPQRVLRDGYGETSPGGLMRSSMQTGPQKTRPRTSRNARPVACMIRVGYPLAARFDRFWAEELNGGARPFVLPNQRADGLPLLTRNDSQITRADGAPILVSAHWLVQFADAPRLQTAGVLFTISFTLDVLP